MSRERRVAVTKALQAKIDSIRHRREAIGPKIAALQAEEALLLSTEKLLVEVMQESVGAAQNGNGHDRKRRGPKPKTQQSPAAEPPVLS